MAGQLTEERQRERRAVKRVWSRRWERRKLGVGFITYGLGRSPILEIHSNFGRLFFSTLICWGFHKHIESRSGVTTKISLCESTLESIYIYEIMNAHYDSIHYLSLQSQRRIHLLAECILSTQWILRSHLSLQRNESDVFWTSYMVFAKISQKKFPHSDYFLVCKRKSTFAFKITMTQV